jgi:hypothetical protein
VSATARAIGGSAVWHSLAPSLYGREMSVSGPVCVGGFEEGKFQGDSPTEEVAAQIRLRGADPVQLRAQEIDEAAKPRIVVQCDPLGVHKVVGQRLGRAGGPVEIEPLGHDEDRKRYGQGDPGLPMRARSNHTIASSMRDCSKCTLPITR